MTLVEQRIYTYLAATSGITDLVSTRLFPHFLEQACEMPALSFFRVSTVPVNDLGGYADVEQPRIQFDCWGSTDDSSKALAKALLDAMEAATTFNALYLSWTSSYEAETKLYREQLDFQCWNETD